MYYFTSWKPISYSYSGFRKGLGESLVDSEGTQLPLLSLQSQDVEHNMSIVTYHIKKCYSCTSDTKAGLVTQACLPIRDSINTLLCLSQHLLITLSAINKYFKF